MSGESIPAILDGRKTQTRRLVRIDDRPIVDAACDHGRLQRGIPSDAKNVWMLGPYLKCDAPPGSHTVSSRVPCPYGIAGDQLWVKEAWRSWTRSCDDGSHEADDEPCSEHCRQTYVAYRATPRIGYRPVPDRARITYLDESAPLESDKRLLGPWRSPMFMPRWASRITLEVTDVRVQRLQEISEDDARAEGITPFSTRYPSYGRDQRLTTGEPATAAEYRASYAVRWDELNGDRAPWVSNPWVWAISFRRVTP